MARVLVTGGSRGIGAAVVRAFARRGHRVSFLYEKNEAAAGLVSQETGAAALRADVADKAAVEAAFREIGPVDILVNNAGICHYGLISRLTPRSGTGSLPSTSGGSIIVSTPPCRGCSGSRVAPS